MEIPHTIAEVRANVAACPSDARFDFGICFSCLVTAPLNTHIEGAMYAFLPGSGALQTLDLEYVDKLPQEIAVMVRKWDENGYKPSRGYMQREEALAWIDAYAKEHAT